MVPAGSADVSNSKSDQRGGTSRSSPTLGMCSRFKGANLEELDAHALRTGKSRKKLRAIVLDGDTYWLPLLRIIIVCVTLTPQHSSLILVACKQHSYVQVNWPLRLSFHHLKRS